ncbi:hypothetical protein [Sagittula sp. S175]|uniref:hypothetical protein n=1 Tax=Sagittula sp. S175 TaxID=3415129 RepID=UPI003C7C569D
MIRTGTVLGPSDVLRLKGIGAGMAPYPDVFPTTEAFAALRNEADGLKVFPASLLEYRGGLEALNAVLPSDVKTYAVGAVGPRNFAHRQSAGIGGFAL